MSAAPRGDSALARVQRAVLGALAAWGVRALGATWRVERSGAEPARAPFVLVTWHQGLLVAAFVLRDRGLWVPLSLSRDGELAQGFLARMGFARSPRGSSSRGGSALLREMIRRVRAGESGGVLPDGPRGPALELKPGVLALAEATGVPLVPVGIAARPAARLGSWDRALLPRPFARVQLHYGAALEIPRSSDAAALEAARARLTYELNRALHAAQERLASP
ncbi:MAG: DUF374 domain-containing protein [Deltaproteobacteria bacterium]|nr:DUF374 domain-containing protein [Deltaproteobacteria bacterium]